MRLRSSGLLLLVVLCVAPGLAFSQAGGAAASRPVISRSPDVAFRVLSWNVSGSAFTEQSADYRKILRLLDPDILLLDEIEGGRTPEEIAAVVRGIRGGRDTTWHMVIGAGGGYQRGVVLSRLPVSPVPAFALLSYPADAMAELRSLMDDSTWTRTKPNLDAGIPAGAAIIDLGRRRILAVTVDLQSGAGTPNWQEARRLIEVREIQNALQQVLRTTRVDAVLMAGDFNAVTTIMPLARITNPYPEPHFAIVPAQAIHLDGSESWTWDGRGTPYPTQALDFSLYSPVSLEPLNAFAFSTEDLSPGALAEADLQVGTSRLVSDHLPIVVDYRWRSK
jgi:endonuclease/exonuclease/phosphatase family metal-dependent hydrolase